MLHFPSIYVEKPYYYRKCKNQSVHGKHLKCEGYKHVSFYLTIVNAWQFCTVPKAIKKSILHFWSQSCHEGLDALLSYAAVNPVDSHWSKWCYSRFTSSSQMRAESHSEHCVLGIHNNNLKLWAWSLKSVLSIWIVFFLIILYGHLENITKKNESHYGKYKGNTSYQKHCLITPYLILFAQFLTNQTFFPSLSAGNSFVQTPP